LKTITGSILKMGISKNAVQSRDFERGDSSTHILPFVVKVTTSAVFVHKWGTLKFINVSAKVSTQVPATSPSDQEPLQTTNTVCFY